MNDLDLVAALAPDVPLATALELAPARQRLSSAFAEQHDARDQVAHARIARPRRRAGSRLALISAGTLAAAAASVAIMLTATPTPPSAVSRSPFGSLPARLTAVQFLSNGARTLLHERVQAPRPDQFIYTMIIQRSTPQTAPRVLRSWLSVSGARRGLIEPPRAVPPGRWVPCTLAQAHATGCRPTAAFLPNLPTDQAGLLAYLEEGSQERHPPRWWTAYVIGQDAWGLETQTYLLPSQKAAVFRLMTRIEGLHLVRHVIDPVGRTGVGIWWRYPGGKVMLIFNPANYDVLAQVAWPAPGSSFRGTVTSVLLRMSVVSRLPHPGNQVSQEVLPNPSAVPSPAPSARS